MNIFVVDANPVLAARDLCDQHVVKMVLETAQLLCSAFNPTVVTPPYKRTHYNHPAAKWTRANTANFDWLVVHGLALAQEYTYRFNKTHKSEAVIRWCNENKNLLTIPVAQTPTCPALCMPDAFKVQNPVLSYRNYYRSKTFARWRYTAPPSWL